MSETTMEKLDHLQHQAGELPSSETSEILYRLIAISREQQAQMAVLQSRLELLEAEKWQGEFATLKSRLPTLWTNSYFVSTVGGAPINVIKQYVENQKNV